MTLRVAAERLLLAAGGVLCTVFLLTVADGFLGSRLALQTFAATDPVGPRSVQAGKSVDFGLWSQKRIDAYQALLSRSFTPPVAVLRIDRVGLEVPVFRGTSELQLNR